MLRYCLWPAAWLPLRLAHAIGAALAALFIRPSSTAYRRAYDHLAQAGLAGDPDDLERLVRCCLRETGRAVAELPALWLRPLHRVCGLVRRVDGWDDTWVRDGRGVIFLTPHLGAFEIASLWIGRLAPLTVLYRPPRQKCLAPLMQAGRMRGQVRTAPTNLKGVRALLQALKQGRAIGLLPDQVPPVKDGVWADFFGRPAWTMTLPARLAAATGAQVVLVAAERLPAGRGYDLHFRPLHAALPADEAAAARAINAEIEVLVRRFPEQYAWTYNRYRAPRPLNPAAEGAA